MDAVFLTTIFEILLFEVRSVFWSAQRVAGSERVEISKKLLEKLKLKQTENTNQRIRIHSLERRVEWLVTGTICSTICWIYSFLLSENSMFSELLENLHVVHKRLTQSKNGVFTFDFKMRLGSTFVDGTVLREILLYITVGVYRDGEYSNAEELLCVIVYIVFRQNSILSVWVYINLSWSAKYESITENSRKKFFVFWLLQWVGQPISFFSFNISTFSTYR